MGHWMDRKDRALRRKTAEEETVRGVDGDHGHPEGENRPRMRQSMLASRSRGCARACGRRHSRPAPEGWREAPTKQRCKKERVPGTGAASEMRRERDGGTASAPRPAVPDPLRFCACRAYGPSPGTESPAAAPSQPDGLCRPDKAQRLPLVLPFAARPHTACLPSPSTSFPPPLTDELFASFQRLFQCHLFTVPD